MRKLTAALGTLCLALAGAPALAAAPTVIGTLDDLTVASTHTLTVTGTCAAGKVLAVFSENGNTSTISDNQSGVWTSSTNVSQGGSGRYRHFYRVLASAFTSGVDSITLNQSSASTAQFAVLCFDGTTVEQAGTVASPTSNNTAQSITTGTIAAAPTYVVAAVGANNSGDTLVDTSSPAWTELAHVGGARGILVSYKLVSSAGGTETFSTSTSFIASWGGGYIAVPEAGGGPTDTPQSPLLTLGVGG